MLAQMYASDASADGVFITGVTSTGIYCLPSCPARKPKAENVAFFPDETGARQAGLRPCKRCRPDDFYAGRDGDQELLTALIDRIQRTPERFPDVASMALEAGVGLSKLHLLTQNRLQTTPAEVLHRCRIEKARDLLSRGNVGATEAAFAVGYESVSAFYRRFKQTTGLTPKAYADRFAHPAEHPSLNVSGTA